MDTQLSLLKGHVAELAANPEFIHHTWFVRWHLEIVEQIATELLKHYPEADLSTVIALCWMHDYGKIINFDDQYSHRFVEEGRNKLIELGFDASFAAQVAENVKTLDTKENLANANIETQIVSTADACSHLVGPFISLYWWENPEIPFEQIMTENIRKQTVDWDKKVTLPEARAAFQVFHDTAMARAAGTIPQIP